MQALRIIKSLMKPSLKIDVNRNSFEKKTSHLIAPSVQSENCESTLSCEYPLAKSRLNNLLKIYFDFAYYSCCSPFHFVLDNNDWFSLKTWKPQQFLCGILHFLGIFRFFTEFRSSVPGVSSQNPIQYFEILGNGFKIIFKMMTVKRLWWNQKEFLSVVNFIEFEKSLPNCDLKLQNKYIVSLLCTMYSLMSLIIVSGQYILAHPSTWSSTWWNRSLVKDGNYAFLLINRTEYITSPIPSPHDISLLDYLLALVLGIGLIERFIMGFYFDLCLLCAVLTLWSTSHAFATRLKRFAKDQLWTNLAGNRSISSMSVLDKPSEKWMELYQSYKGIRTLSQLINNAYGNMTTAFIAESILYHSMNMDAILLTSDGFNQARLIFFILSSSFTFIFSADICTQMDSLKAWLSKDENRRNVPLDELNVVLHELQTTVIGIRGSNIFTITYSLVWNMITTVVTYFIICVQSRGLNNGNGGGRE